MLFHVSAPPQSNDHDSQWALRRKMDNAGIAVEVHGGRDVLTLSAVGLGDAPTVATAVSVLSAAAFSPLGPSHAEIAAHLDDATLAESTDAAEGGMLDDLVHASAFGRQGLGNPGYAPKGRMARHAPELDVPVYVPLLARANRAELGASMPRGVDDVDAAVAAVQQTPHSR